MGQICIDKEYRGQGVFRGLYQFMKTEICFSRFSSIITEIDVNNSRSLRAHNSIGFTKIKDYKCGDKNWRLVSLKV
jgi:L-amino acid N-acyltransferase YncA